MEFSNNGTEIVVEKTGKDFEQWTDIRISASGKMLHLAVNNGIQQ